MCTNTCTRIHTIRADIRINTEDHTPSSTQYTLTHTYIYKNTHRSTRSAAYMARLEPFQAWRTCTRIPCSINMITLQISADIWATVFARMRTLIHNAQRASCVGSRRRRPEGPTRCFDHVVCLRVRDATSCRNWQDCSLLS